MYAVKFIVNINTFIRSNSVFFIEMAYLNLICSIYNQ